ncbi:MAG: hypothetical protein V3V78_05430 [Candidatus Woesearchaeota archaeon]
MNEEIEKIGFFLQGYPIAVEKKVNSSLFPPFGSCVKVLDFVELGDSLEKIVRRALSWVGRKRYHGFGVLHDKLKVGNLRYLSKKDKEYPKEAMRDRRARHAYIAPFRGDFHLLGDLEKRACGVMDNWLVNKEMPQEVYDLWTDSSEDHEKLQYMLGVQLYRLKRRKGFSQELRKCLDHHKKIMLDSIKAIDKHLTDRYERAEFNIEELEHVVAVVATGIKNYFFERKYTDESLDATVSAMAQAAYEIRSTYPRKGWEVRTGLVFWNDYPRLTRRAMEISSDPATPDIIMYMTILNRKDWGGYNYRTGAWDVCDPEFGMPPLYRISREDYSEIGGLRVRELIEEGKAPYKKERELMTKILNLNLNKKQFRGEVDNWLAHYSRDPVKWEGVNFNGKEGSKQVG